ncbi:MAG: hypothetical protein ACTHKE_10045 [Sphingomicrobium sp.]
MMLTLPMAAQVSAQSLQARKIPDAQFIRVEFIKFRPGGEDRAFELEDKYLTPAWKRSGLTPPLELHLQTGPWDRIYVYELKSGMAEMEWQVSPDRARFLNALSTIAGGEREALRITAEWDGLVERRESYVGHRHPVH